ncbi:uncharacterized protein JN550_004364 [Neoarthrinium moseri]|uniref:uncharacterized protein n=1 Tax=Neoarthrinium moseri TaxID=1658444 RepID=UPI001FDC5725|nr:uncharacterized protein JN550_004364 [Neoarthrinium moseri]KAI1871370.1 hypothetical protein JN550_004364 [Neoarthrinium moseri]
MSISSTDIAKVAGHTVTIEEFNVDDDEGPQLVPQSCPPKVSRLGMLREVATLAFTRLRVSFRVRPWNQTASPRPLSEKGLFMYHYVEPLFQWWGANLRILKSQSLGVVAVADASGATTTLINGASHNYAGLYKAFPESEELQRLCLDQLPVSDSDAVPLLRNAVHRPIAEFLNTAFCFTTSTGYGANYVALPALIENTKTAVVMDHNCHNSMFTGVFLGKCTSVWKFKHNHIGHLQSILEELAVTEHRVIVLIEGLYSMDGDIPPLDKIYQLKQKFGFVLYCDEAHSFLSLGSSGRGCLEFWNEAHPNAILPWEMFDIPTGTLSKAVGGIGGFIVGQSQFQKCIQQRISSIDEQSNISVLTSTMVQTLWVLGHSAILNQNLCRLSEISQYCRSELARAGVYIYGHPGTPVLPVWAGRPSKSAELSYCLRKVGLLASPVSAPAVPFWESRVRVNLSADYSDDDVNKLRAIQDLVQATVSSCPNYPALDASALAVGHRSRNIYGIGAGSARWISGTFPSHLTVEAMLSHATGTEAAMVYPDESIGLTSTIAALARPIIGFKEHYILVPRRFSGLVRDGLALIPPSRTKAGFVESYDIYDDLALQIRRYKGQAQGAKACFTVYVRVTSIHDDEAEYDAIPKSLIPKILRNLSATVSKKCNITVLLHTSSDLLSTAELGLPVQAGLNILIYGSFARISALPGGYLAGARSLIGEFRYTSRGYMYTTSMPPFIMDMMQSLLERKTCHYLKPFMSRDAGDDRPLVVMTCGLAGAGKTTTAKAILGHYPNFERLSIDEIVFAKHGIYGVDYPADEILYEEYLNEAGAIYLDRFQKLLRERRDIILERSFYAKEDRDEFRSYIENEGARIVLVYLHAGDKERLWARICERSAKKKDANSAFDITRDTFNRYWDGFEAPVGEGEIVIEVT